MDERRRKIFYKKLMTLQWLLRRYQMMNCKEHNIYENRNEGQGRVLALLKIQRQRLRRKIWHISSLIV